MLSKRLHGGPGSEELRQLIAPALKVSFFLKKKKLKIVTNVFVRHT